MALTALPGFRDFYPDEFAARHHIVTAWRRVAKRYAFLEYDGPPIEPLELYTKKSGDEITAQLYTFTDKGGRQVALRPEMTPTLARMVAARVRTLRTPVRWFTIPQLFRYERQQRGRLREHFQLNVDIVGEGEGTADAELLAAAVAVLEELGLTVSDVVVRIGDRRLLTAYLDALSVTDAQKPVVFAVIDKLGRIARGAAHERLAAVGLSTTVVERVLEVGALSFDEIRVAIGDRAADHARAFEQYLAYLEALGIRDWVQVDLSIVRGLAYYTGIVFEIFDRKGELRAVCGGGRYDKLLGAAGGPDLPALGFGMGDVVLGDLLSTRGRLPVGSNGIDYWVTAAADNYFTAREGIALTDVMTAAAVLRRSGRSVEYALRPQSLGKQIKAATAVGARELVLLAADFPATRQITLRQMIGRSTANDERSLTLEALVAERGASHHRG